MRAGPRRRLRACRPMTGYLASMTSNSAAGCQAGFQCATATGMTRTWIAAACGATLALSGCGERSRLRIVQDDRVIASSMRQSEGHDCTPQHGVPWRPSLPPAALLGLEPRPTVADIVPVDSSADPMQRASFRIEAFDKDGIACITLFAPKGVLLGSPRLAFPEPGTCLDHDTHARGYDSQVVPHRYVFDEMKRERNLGLRLLQSHHEPLAQSVLRGWVSVVLTNGKGKRTTTGWAYLHGPLRSACPSE